MSEAEWETVVLKESHTKAGKESKEAITKKEAEMKALKRNHDQTAKKWGA